jgi:hypothetical protein
MALRRPLPASPILGSILTVSLSSPFKSEVVQPGPGALNTGRARYRPGDQGTVTLRNHASWALGFNLCPRQLEQQLGDRWIVRERSPGPGEVCTAERRLLEPGETVGTTFRLPRGLAAGTYRWRFFGVEVLAGARPGRGEHLTNSFRVELDAGRDSSLAPP